MRKAGAVGSSFVEFHDEGFWVSDSSLEIWLALLVEQIDSLSSPDGWLRELREQWRIATGGCNGCVSTYLDQYLTSDEHRGMVLSLCERALQQLNSYGTSISKEELNRLNAAHVGARWGGIYQSPSSPM